MNIIHIVASIEKVNFGIWNAAIFGSQWLHEQHGFTTTLWVCQEQADDHPEVPVSVIFLGGGSPAPYALAGRIENSGYTPHNTVIVTHGAWGQQTKIGYSLKKLGYFWVYAPHGMLEPWSMQHKKWKKMIYFALFERWRARRANVIRAVGAVEQQNLQRLFKKKTIVVIENGVRVPEYQEKPDGPRTFLFMARLHFKKGIEHLVRAWTETPAALRARLIIAGPDEGELTVIEPYLSDVVQYVGAVYNEEKMKLLREAHYYALPSFSEGFPTSVVEAMSYGAIPLISVGCNFPEVFSEKLGYQIEPDEASIIPVLKALKFDVYDEALSRRNYEYVREHLSEEKIGAKLLKLYSSVG